MLTCSSLHCAASGREVRRDGDGHEACCAAASGVNSGGAQPVIGSVQERDRFSSRVVARRYEHRAEGRGRQARNHQGLQEQGRGGARRNMQRHTQHHRELTHS